MPTKYTLLLSIVFFSHSLYSQAKIATVEVDTVKVLEFLKKIYSDTDYLAQFFEEDLNASKYLNSNLSEVNWNKTYTKQDQERIVNEIKTNIAFDLGQEKARFKVPDTSKAYQHLSVVFSLPEGIDKEFMEVYFEPTKILIGNKLIEPYPKDRAAKFNEDGFFSYDGEYIQRIPIPILKSEEISGRIKVEGILKIAIASKMVRIELEENKEVKTVQSKTYELLGRKKEKAYLKVNKTKGESFKVKDYKLCVGEEGIKNCGTMLTVPYRFYDYLSKGMENYDSIVYSKILDSFTYADFKKEDKVILINSKSGFDKVLLFTPDQILSVEDNISKSTLNYGEEVQLIFDRIQRWKNATIWLTFEVMGLIKRADNYIKIEEITNAVDNNGKVLKKTPSIFKTDEYYTYQKRNNVDFKLDISDSTATAISSIQGTLKYFYPTIENKGKILIQDAFLKTNTDLLASTDREVELYLLSYEGHQDLITQKEEEISQLEKQMKEVAELFNTTNGAELQKKMKTLEDNRRLLARMVNLIKQPFQDKETIKENTLKFYVYDPAHRLVDINVYNEEKKKISRNWGRSSFVPQNVSITLDSKPTSNLLLEVLIESEESCRIFPFEVKDIKLPKE